MKMKSCFLLLLYFGLPCCREVSAASDHDVKRGMYSYMAFIYYSDPSVVDTAGQRFIRSAILIRSNWLVTTAIGPSANGFPEKTLLARTGAIAIDPKFTLNEDEDEQEQEIVQIVRPYNHSATQWWTTDISLLKTLLSFNMTSAVGFKALNTRSIVDPKICSILVYAKKFGNSTDEKTLMSLNVEILPSSIDNCGSHFSASTMICAADSEDNKDATYEAEFCQGNSGGPLICENEVIGLQTYIGNNCKQPHLYQLLKYWDTFITCSIEDKCQEENCGNICDVNYKDKPKVDVRVTPPITHDTGRDVIEFINIPSTQHAYANSTIPTITTVSTTTTTTTSTTTTPPPAPPSVAGTFDQSDHTDEMGISTTNVTLTTNKPFVPETTHTTAKRPTPTTTEPPTKSEQSKPWPKVKETPEPWPKVKGQKSNYKHEDGTHTTWPNVKETNVPQDTQTPWLVVQKVRPRQKLASNIYREDESEDSERNANVEAQQHPTPTKALSASNRKICLVQTLLFVLIVLCL